MRIGGQQEEDEVGKRQIGREGCRQEIRQQQQGQEERFFSKSEKGERRQQEEGGRNRSRQEKDSVSTSQDSGCGTRP